MKKYGVLLKLYAGQELNLWVHETADRFETYDEDEAYTIKHKYETNNPKGLYLVEEIKEDF